MPRVTRTNNASRALETQERELWLARFHSWGRTSLVVVASSLTLMAFSLVVMDKLFAPQAFQIQELEISGKFKFLQPQDIEAKLREQPLGNFFSVDLERIRTDIGDMKWVAEVGVRRLWPNKLVIWVREHRPVAIWKTLGESSSSQVEWVTSDGSIIQAELSPALTSQADVLVGSRSKSKDLLKQSLIWKRYLAPVGLELQQLELSRTGAWSMKLLRHQASGSFDLLLGQSDMNSRLNRFVSLYQSKFSGRHVELRRVDARYPNGLAIEKSEDDSSTDEVGLVLEQPTTTAKARVI